MRIIIILLLLYLLGSSEKLFAISCPELDQILYVLDSLEKTERSKVKEYLLQYKGEEIQCKEVDKWIAYYNMIRTYNPFDQSKEARDSILNSLITLADKKEILKWSKRLRVNKLSMLTKSFENMESVEYLLNDIISLCGDSRDDKVLSYAYFNTANFYNKLLQYRKSIPLYNKAIEHGLLDGTNKIVGLGHAQLGYINRQINEVDKAIYHALKAVDYSGEGVRAYNKQVMFNNLSYWYFEKNKFDSARVFNDFSMKIDPGNYRVLTMKSRLFRNDNQLDSSMLYLTKAEQKIRNHDDLNNILALKASVYEKMNNYDVANRLYLESIRIQDEVDRDFDNKRKMYTGYLRTSFFLKNEKENASFLDSIVYLNSKITRTNIEQEITKYEVEYSTQKKERENQLLKKDQALKEARIVSQRSQLVAISIVLSVLLMASIFFYTNARKRKKNNDLLASKNQKLSDQKKRIETLNRELNHRANSNLTLIYNLMQLQKQQVEGLSKEEILNVNSQRVKSLAMIQNYLSEYGTKQEAFIDIVNSVIESLTYGHSPSIARNLDLESTLENPEQVLLVSLIINELVTNSLKYAFKDHPTPSISIQSTVVDGWFKFDYSDNGTGVNEGVVNAGKGTELINIFIEQLNGTSKFEVDGGYSFKFGFPK